MQDRLRLLTARLDEAVTELLELGLRQGGGPVEGSAEAVTGSVDALLDDIAALHEGLREAGAASSGADPAPAATPADSPVPPVLPSAAPPSPPASVVACDHGNDRCAEEALAVFHRQDR